VKEFTRPRAERIPRRQPPALEGTVSRLDRIIGLAAALALGLTAFLAIEPTQNWLLLLLCGLAALGTDGIVRNHPRARFQRLDDTALFLFVPVLFTLGMGLFFKEVAGGQGTVLAGIASVIPYYMVLRAEYESVHRGSDSYHYHRLVLNGATYIIAFLFFATIYDFNLPLLTSAFAAGIIGVLLAIEVLREEALDTARTILYAAAVGLLVGQSAWATHFLPLQGGAAAVFLLLAFYLMSGLMHNYLAQRLTARTAGEFGAVALAGLLMVALAHAWA
jgi:hypothetical protein